MPEPNRRRAYRQPGGQTADIALELRLLDGEPFAGSLVDVSAGGCCARSTRRASLSAGQKVDLEVRDSRGQRTRLPAEVLAPKQRGHDWRFGMRFMTPPVPGAVDERSFYRTINRRGAYRVPVSERDEVRVSLAVRGDDGVVEQLGDAQLRNLSASGAGLLASAATELRLGGRSGVLVSLGLPGLPLPLQLVAVVRNVARQADGCYLGVEFDTHRSEDYLDTAEDILEFVMQRLQPA